MSEYEYPHKTPQVDEVWHDVDKHDGRWWPYKIVGVNKKTYTVEPLHTDSLEPVGQKWRYRIPKDQFDDHQTRHRPIGELEVAKRDPRVRAFLDEADEYLADFERQGRNL